ncbi:MAG: hypothetical protein Q4G39_09375, partial [Brachymonas sp.]|nr:hypothetical protein [Brachymonas sp.]
KGILPEKAPTMPDAAATVAQPRPQSQIAPVAVPLPAAEESFWDKLKRWFGMEPEVVVPPAPPVVPAERQGRSG